MKSLSFAALSLLTVYVQSTPAEDPLIWGDRILKKSKSDKGAAKAGKSSYQCPVKESLPEGIVICDDIFSSLDNITSYLLDDEDAYFEGHIISDDDGEDYEDAKEQYASPTYETSPSYIVQVKTETDVRSSVLFASECAYTLSVRSGGHAYLAESSCDGGENPCIQIDVGMMNHIEAITSSDGSKQLRVGPAAHLESLAEEGMKPNEVFLPTGECTDIGVGGHMQTGGWGVFSRAFGAFANWVHSFNIVLADGSLHTITKPADSKGKSVEDDLFYSVLGGSAGSYGVVTDVVMDTVDETKYQSFFWKVNFLYAADTVPGIIAMMENWAHMVQGDKMNENSRWSSHWSIVGSKSVLDKAFSDLGFGEDNGFNYLQFDMAWIVSKDEGLSDEKAFEEAEDFAQAIFDACSPCVRMEDILPPPLQPTFGSIYGLKAPLSHLLVDASLFDFDAFGLDFPKRQTWQQGPHIPSPEDVVEIVKRVDSNMPMNGLAGGDFWFVLSQMTTAPNTIEDESRAISWQDDVFGVVFDMWDLTASSMTPFVNETNYVQEAVISGFGVDHRAHWSVWGDESFECDGWKKYYDDKKMYNRLVDVKACVDSGNLFQHIRSLPVETKGCKAGKEGKSGKATKAAKTS